MPIQPIRFSFQPDNSVTFELEADVELPGSAPYYQVKNIHLAGSGLKTPVIPDTFIKCVLKQGHRFWVHIDSNLPTELSSSIGKCLENTLPKVETVMAKDVLQETDDADMP
jgi:hypothetical protein